MRKTLLVAVAAALPLAAHAQETTLKLVSAFGETTTYVKHDALDPEVQRRGQGHCPDQFHRRTEGDPDLRGRHR